MSSLRAGVNVLGGGFILLGCFILYSALPGTIDAQDAIPFSAVSAAEASTDDTIRQSFQASPGGYLDLSTDRGSITVVAGSSNEVRVEVERRGRTSEIARSFDVLFFQDGDTIHLEGETDEGRSWLGRVRAPEVEFYIHVPAEYNLALGTKGGSIQVGDLTGDVEMRTAGGSLTLGEIEGNVQVNTSGGSIALASIVGDAHLRTSGGSIKVDALNGNADVRTAGGSITLGSVRGVINARTSGGSITAGLIHELHRESSLETAGGGLSVSLAPSAHLIINASTSVGRISSNLDLSVEDSWTSSKMEGTVGNGGPMLTLRTAAGSISIERG